LECPDKGILNEWVYHKERKRDLRGIRLGIKGLRKNTCVPLTDITSILSKTVLQRQRMTKTRLTRSVYE